MEIDLFNKADASQLYFIHISMQRHFLSKNIYKLEFDIRLNLRRMFTIITFTKR